MVKRSVRTVTRTIAVVTEAAYEQDDINSLTEEQPGVVL